MEEGNGDAWVSEDGGRRSSTSEGSRSSVQVLGSGAWHHQWITSSSYPATSDLSLASRAPCVSPTPPPSKLFSSRSMSRLLLDSALILPGSGLVLAHCPPLVSLPLKCDPPSSHLPVPVFHSPLAISSASVLLCCLFKACFPCLSHPITSSSVTREKALTYLIMESDGFQVNEGSSPQVGLLMLR